VKILVLQDPDEKDIRHEVIVETDLSEDKLQEAVNRIKEDFCSKNLEDWTYEDLLDELERRGCIRVISSDLLLVRA